MYNKDDDRNEQLIVLHQLRQQSEKNNKPNLCLSDYIAPVDLGINDYMGAFAVTTGVGIEKKIREYENQNDDYNIIMLKAVADRLAEAFAELMHAKVRKELWGYIDSENLTNEELIEEKYTGIRPAIGYPACPEHSEKKLIFNLLDAEKNTSINLTEHFAMDPAASVSGLYFSHPEARYFNIGKIAKDQVEDYSKRKDKPVE